MKCGEPLIHTSHGRHQGTDLNTTKSIGVTVSSERSAAEDRACTAPARGRRTVSGWHHACMTSFEQVAARFWDPEITSLILPPLTQDMVNLAERDLGVVLPEDLLRLLSIQNGGVVAESWNSYPAGDTFYADDHVPFDHLFGIGPAGQSTVLTLLDTPYLVQEWNLPSPVVLLSGQGHYWVAMDYRGRGPAANPSITWIDNEMDHELPLAPDFRTFVEGLASSPSIPG